LAIEEMLALHAKSFAFKLSLKYVQKLPRVVLYDETVAQDFDIGHKDFFQLKIQNG
jgi:hypothetical protein